jgi:NAD(P)H-hydrate epimerase
MAELRILLGDNRISEKDFRKHLGNNIILLKGKKDVIYSKNKREFNKTGNPGMTVGGTGDVLAGICAGLLAQKHSLFQAAKKAAYIDGRIGDRLKRKLGYGFTASEMLGFIPKYFK